MPSHRRVARERSGLKSGRRAWTNRGRSSVLVVPWSRSNPVTTSVSHLARGATIDTTSNDSGFASRARRGLVALKIVPLVGLVAFVLHGRNPRDVSSQPDPSEAVVRALSAQGLRADPDDVAWIDAPRHSLKDTLRGSTRAVVRAETNGDVQHDVYLVRARLSPEGRVVSVESIHALTKTSDVDETRPVVREHTDWIALATNVPSTGVATGVELYSLAGEDPHTTDGWTRTQKIQNAITNLQTTGSLLGVKRLRYELDPQATKLTLSWESDRLAVQADNHRIVVDPNAGAPIEGSQFVRFSPVEKGAPGDLITWTVDRVRAVPWLGPDVISFLEDRAFKVHDWLKRHFASWFGQDVAKEVQENVGEAKVKPTYTDPEIGWPPPPLEPILQGALPNEGVWMTLEDDPFVGHNPGLPSAFVTSFIRVDPQRAYATVYITLWDPRQVELNMVAGTVEPVSATGEVGTGQIPRTPEVLSKVVAGFNGGFQAVHFEGGMQVNGTMYLPPKPYAATVADLLDGTTAIGTWPANLSEVPDEILSFRQNLVPLVRDGEINPYHQVKWGGVVGPDNIHTTRSGVCLTQEGFVGYFFGFDLSQDSLARGMLAARCTIGVHLDMNAGHTGFEFYRVAPTGVLPPLDHYPDGRWEAESTVPQLDGWSFRARRMIKGMPHMLFPRYINRDARDFMYLTLRSVLPGNNVVPRVTPAEPKEGEWTVKGLPQHGFPYAIALTKLRPDEKNPGVRAHLLKIDPRAIRLGAPPSPGAEDTTVITFGGAVRFDAAAKTTLWLSAGTFTIAATSPGPTAVPLFDGEPPTSGALAAADALLGVADEDGMLHWIVADSPGSASALSSLLKELGCSQQMVAPKALVPRLGGSLDLDLELATTPLAGPTVTLVRGEAPSARTLFPDTPVVPPEVWMPLQAKRVRYFPKHAVKPGVVPKPPPTK